MRPDSMSGRALAAQLVIGLYLRGCKERSGLRGALALELRNFGLELREPLARAA